MQIGKWCGGHRIAQRGQGFKFGAHTHFKWVNKPSKPGIYGVLHNIFCLAVRLADSWTLAGGQKNCGNPIKNGAIVG
jgi:hypothetical protein